MQITQVAQGFFSKHLKTAWNPRHGPIKPQFRPTNPPEALQVVPLGPAHAISSPWTHTNFRISSDRQGLTHHLSKFIIVAHTKKTMKEQKKLVNHIFSMSMVIAMHSILLLITSSTASAQSSEVDDILRENQRLIYCANLQSEIAKQESYRNYNQANQLRQQYRYGCGQ